MRGAVDQHRVLAAGGFVLAAVDHDDGAHPAAYRGLGDGAQLLGEGEPRAAAAAQRYLPGQRGQLLTAHRFERAVHFQMHVEVESLDQVEARGELGETDDADFGDVGQRGVH